MRIKDKKTKLRILKEQRTSEMAKNDGASSHRLDREISSLEQEIQDALNHYKTKRRNARSR
ncbi:MAG: hypothetical protein JEZ08_16420 [Clostridiales bacterium]|nr:hypothetical protein [Clostridiales bacterium]